MVIRTIFFLIPIILFTGCVIQPEYNKKPEPTNFDKMTMELTTYEFCSNIKTKDTLYVTDFVNQKDYQNVSELGFILSNSTKANILRDMCSPKTQIKAFNLSNYVTINQNGVKMLSRNLEDMKTKTIQGDKQVAIGTYTITSTQIILFLKLINLESGNTISSTQTTYPMNDEILQLDGKGVQNPEPYIKKPFHL